MELLKDSTVNLDIALAIGEMEDIYPSRFKPGRVKFTGDLERGIWTVYSFGGSIRESFKRADMLADLLRERLQRDMNYPVSISIDRDALSPSIYVEWKH